MVLGYGSCTYCDAVRSCESLEDLKDLVNNTWRSIRWFDLTSNSFKEYEDNEIYMVQHWFHTPVGKEFFEVAKAHAKKAMAELLLQRD